MIEESAEGRGGKGETRGEERGERREGRGERREDQATTTSSPLAHSVCLAGSLPPTFVQVWAVEREHLVSFSPWVVNSNLEPGQVCCTTRLHHRPSEHQPILDQSCTVSVAAQLPYHPVLANPYIDLLAIHCTGRL